MHAYAATLEYAENQVAAREKYETKRWIILAQVSSVRTVRGGADDGGVELYLEDEPGVFKFSDAVITLNKNQALQAAKLTKEKDYVEVEFQPTGTTVLSGTVHNQLISRTAITGSGGTIRSVNPDLKALRVLRARVPAGYAGQVLKGKTREEVIDTLGPPDEEKRHEEKDKIATLRMRYDGLVFDSHRTFTSEEKEKYSGTVYLWDTDKAKTVYHVQ